jgi:hypothetical protein
MPDLSDLSQEDISNLLKNVPVPTLQPSQPSAASQLLPGLLGMAVPGLAKGAGALVGKLGLAKLSPSLAALFLSNPKHVGSGMREHHILDDDLNRVGKMVVSPQGNNLYMHSISGPEGLGGASIKNQLGTSQMRSLLNALKEEYPEAETVSGVRITGSRHGEAAPTTEPEVDREVSMRIRPPFEQRQQQEVDRLINDPAMQEIVRRNMSKIKL